MTVYDAIIIGGGALGLSSTFFLAQSGMRVLCIDRFNYPHPWSASTGESRLFRQAYFEDERYIPLLKRASDLWQTIEQHTQTRLLHQSGFLVVSDDASATHERIMHNASIHDIPVDILTRRQIIERYHHLSLPSTSTAIFERGAGILQPERVMSALLSASQNFGAHFVNNQRVLRFSKRGSVHEVVTDDGNYFSRFVVVSPGSFINDLVTIPMTFTIKRAVQFWFRCSDDYSLARNFPCFAFASPDDFIYGFPALNDDGIKLGRYQSSLTIDNPHTTSSDFTQDELTPIQEVLKFLPKASVDAHRHKVCFYNLTSDENFLVDKDPNDNSIIYATGGSGHAFKFAPVIGEIVAQLIRDKPSPFSIEIFKFRT